MINISAVIITYNEEKNVERCITSLQKVADEIVVVDSFSTDRTKEICLQKKVRFIENKFEGHIEQKNFAVQCASNAYILSLDADEVLSPELELSILEVKSNWIADGYSFNRLTNYCDRWIRHSGWYPDTKLRLWHKQKGKWGGENPHDRMILKKGSQIIHLAGDLYHYSYHSVSHHLDQINKYTNIAAKEAQKKSKKTNVMIHMILNPIFAFCKSYILKGGIFDGYYGFVIGVLTGYGKFIKYLKLKELNKGR